mmetsp:Transcript_80177/g.226984  ORF Transcript_80177/g.226984 Transcript_80177/m.226984 type:complete len:386 (+) Transcript_80177:1494-2651(+)
MHDAARRASAAGGRKSQKHRHFGLLLQGLLRLGDGRREDRGEEGVQAPDVRGTLAVAWQRLRGAVPGTGAALGVAVGCRRRPGGPRGRARRGLQRLGAERPVLGVDLLAPLREGLDFHDELVGVAVPLDIDIDGRHPTPLRPYRGKQLCPVHGAAVLLVPLSLLRDLVEHVSNVLRADVELVLVADPRELVLLNLVVMVAVDAVHECTDNGGVDAGARLERACGELRDRGDRLEVNLWLVHAVNNIVDVCRHSEVRRLDVIHQSIPRLVGVLVVGDVGLAADGLLDVLHLLGPAGLPRPEAVGEEHDRGRVRRGVPAGCHAHKPEVGVQKVRPMAPFWRPIINEHVVHCFLGRLHAEHGVLAALLAVLPDARQPRLRRRSVTADV